MFCGKISHGLGAANVPINNHGSVKRKSDQGDTPEIMDAILTTAIELELEVNEDDIEELIMGYEDELKIEELQEILNERTPRNTAKCVSF
ncbi:hypothetical protein TNCV_1599681 [Trichonephila clavipes]|nr:hypothetical protein TNCV_1599681 [Trichonephila clavipes]